MLPTLPPPDHLLFSQDMNACMSLNHNVEPTPRPALTKSAGPDTQYTRRCYLLLDFRTLKRVSYNRPSFLTCRPYQILTRQGGGVLYIFN